MPGNYTDTNDSVNGSRPAVTVSNKGVDAITLTIGDLAINGLLSLQQECGLVASFRNLKYASISSRWYEAVPLDLASQKGVWEATQWGPRPPQTLDKLHELTGHLYPRLSIYDAESEFECLNLNVYTPATALGSIANPDSGVYGLPVIVWIHGGSFEWGDGGCEFDGQYLVSHSMQIGQPVLVVGINYRLGMLGFFTSKELRQEARDRGEAGYSNLGFHDQRLALQWVQNNIHFFGGDASRILLAGESAGAISILAHLRSKVPVSSSALLMSPGTVWPKSFTETQTTFDQACEKLDPAGARTSTREKLDMLRSLPCEKLHELGANRVEIILCEDPIFFDDWSGQRFEEIPAFPPWIRRVMVGELSEETAAMAHYWEKLSPTDLLGTWRQLYQDPEYAMELLAVYGISGDEDSGVGGVCGSSRVVDALVDYTSDALFGKAVRSIAETHLSVTPTLDQGNHRYDARLPQPQVYLYRFDQPDTVAPPGQHYGRAYHSLDNAFLFYFPSVAGAEASQDLRTTADSFSGAALRLAYGDELWEELSTRNKKFATFSGDGLQIREQTKARWESLINTPDRIDQFLLGKDLLWKTAAIATGKSDNLSS